MIESQWQIARANSFSSYSTMLECESYCERSLRSGLVSSRTVGRKLGNLLTMVSFSAGRGVAGAGGMMADSRRLEVREREEPRLDLLERFRRSFIRLLISVMCSSRSFSIAALSAPTSSPLARTACSRAANSCACRWLALFNPSFSSSSRISFARQSANSSFRIFSALRKASCCAASWAVKSWVSRSTFLRLARSASSSLLRSRSNSRLAFSIATVFSSTSSFSFRSCFSMYWLASLREDTAPVVRDRSNSRLLLSSRTSRTRSSSACISFFPNVFTSPAADANSRSQLAFRVAFSWSRTASFEACVSRDARRWAISEKRKSTSEVCVVRRAAVSSSVSRAYFSRMDSHSSWRAWPSSWSCASRAARLRRQASACASQVCRMRALFSTSPWISAFLAISSCVRRSFSEFNAYDYSVNYFTAGYRPRIGLPFTDIQYQNQLQMIPALPRITTPTTAIAKAARNWFSGEKLVTSMNEVTEGDRFFEERNVAQAAAYYEQSLSILPLYAKRDPHYNSALEAVAWRLAQCHAYRADLAKLHSLTTRLLQAAAAHELQCGPQVQLLSDTLSILGRHALPISNPRSLLLRDLYAAAATRLDGKHESIPSLLTKQTKEADATELEWLVHGEVRSGTAFVLLSLLAVPSLPANPLFNKACNSLLKTAEKSAQKNVLKALTVVACNLLRKGQFLQAEGMLQYCLDRKRENLKPTLLQDNHEYALLSLLLASTFEGVQRLEEARRLKEQFGKKMELGTMVAQHLLLDSL